MIPRDMWTRLAIDPLADPLARVLAPRAGVTPNRVTAVASLLGVAAAACLATGRLRLGGGLFLLRFFTDCLDGKIARQQGSSTERGALFDVASDVVCVSAAYACLGLWAIDAERVSAPVVAGLLVALGCHLWALDHRKHLADRAGLGEGRSDLAGRTDLPLLDPWLRFCRRIRMNPVPWTVEVETLVLGLLPLAGPRPAAAGLVFGLVFYVTATGINLRRCRRIAARLDVVRRREPSERATS
ncbi:hypothetical protein FHP29_19560 [Nocardioides albidus]|uniref:CDP-alcohol phosphatidyltransferase family protein n=1 Tax=Nocardioides albidus TaxID=1517589 RepID=A0A5C4VKH4_9ACTN|nr:CDP-alcohol phosphatidyltransferase family protein [Nocardioides albidus]TNM36353.1 hypothetical protein FHP29_19560 [Nocardioides albidus]